MEHLEKMIQGNKENADANQKTLWKDLHEKFMVSSVDDILEKVAYKLKKESLCLNLN